MPLEIVAAGLFILLLFSISSSNKKPPVVVSSSPESYEHREMVRRQSTLTPLLIAIVLCLGLYYLAKIGNEEREAKPVQQEVQLEDDEYVEHLSN
jgi:hypothetical protein